MGYQFGIRYIDMVIYHIDMVIRDIDMGCGLMMWEMTISIRSEMTISIRSSPISIWEILSPCLGGAGCLEVCRGFAYLTRGQGTTTTHRMLTRPSVKITL